MHGEIENKEKCKLIVSTNNNILEIKISGQLTEFTAEQLLKDILLLAKEPAYRNYLFDFRSLYGTLGIRSSYFFIQNFSFERSKNIAIVAKKENENYYYFIQTVAYNRGMNLRYFDLIEEAKEWLEEEHLRALMQGTNKYLIP